MVITIEKQWKIETCVNNGKQLSSTFINCKIYLSFFFLLTGEEHKPTVVQITIENISERHQ